MQVKERNIKFGTGVDDVSASSLPANRTATNYTPTDASTKGHLDGIDSAIGSVTPTSGDISHTNFSLTNNQAAPANVTGLNFSNAVTRSAEILYSIAIDATVDIFEVGKLMLIQKASDWEIVRSFDGDNSLISFSVTSAGQVQYTSSDYAGFSSGAMRFRSITTKVS